MGIRTPWSLDDDEVWRRTHYVGARCFVVAGLMMVVGVLAGSPWSIVGALGGTVVAVLIPLVYSYWAWRRAQASR